MYLSAIVLGVFSTPRPTSLAMALKGLAHPSRVCMGHRSRPVQIRLVVCVCPIRSCSTIAHCFPLDWVRAKERESSTRSHSNLTGHGWRKQPTVFATALVPPLARVPLFAPLRRTRTVDVELRRPLPLSKYEPKRYYLIIIIPLTWDPCGHLLCLQVVSWPRYCSARTRD